MKDVLLIALFALGGAACAGVLGAGVLRLVRRRSVAVSLAVIAGVTVTAMLAGTLAVAEAMFLSPHDLGVVTLVVAMAAVVSLATALLLGRWVVARSRELSLAARDFGDGGRFAAPPGQTTAELDALSRELAATSDRLAASRERSGLWRPRGGSWSPGSRTTCGPRWPGCGRCRRHWRTAWPPIPAATTGRSAPRWSGSTRWSGTCSSCRASTRGRWR